MLAASGKIGLSVNLMLENVAQKVIQRYFLRPGQVITDMARREDDVHVSVGRSGWRVERWGKDVFPGAIANKCNKWSAG